MEFIVSTIFRLYSFFITFSRGRLMALKADKKDAGYRISTLRPLDINAVLKYVVFETYLYFLLIPRRLDSTGPINVKPSISSHSFKPRGTVSNIT